MIEHDYTKEPNRFTLKMLYNDKLIVTTDKRGNKREAKRDIFKFPYNEPNVLGNNHLKDRSLIQDEKNNPHIYEKNIFENSWEAVEMGEKLIEVFRLAMRIGTEDYISREYNEKKRKGLSLDYINQSSKKGNKFTIVLMDNLSIKRDSRGKKIKIQSIKDRISVLKEKDHFGDITRDEYFELTKLEDKVANSYTKRELYRCSFSADDYSYDGDKFTPPLSRIWKNFNVNSLNYYNFDTSNRFINKEDIVISDISNYNEISNKMSICKIERKKILKILEESKNGVDHIRQKFLEKNLEDINKKMYFYESHYFKGLRSIIKNYLNREYYSNRFTQPKPKFNNYKANSSESEITKLSIVWE